MGMVRAQIDETVLGKAYDSRIARRLVGFLMPYRHRLVMVTAFVIFGTAADLSMPFLFSQAIDEVSGRGFSRRCLEGLGPKGTARPLGTHGRFDSLGGRGLWCSSRCPAIQAHRPARWQLRGDGGET